MLRAPHLLLTFILLALAACGGGADGVVRVGVVGESGQLTSSGVRLSPGGQLVRAATAQGLVALDQNGDVVPGLADSWIVTDDGRSYIFRLRNARWPDGSRIDGRSARDALARAMAALDGTSLGLDLAPVSEVRAMAGRVVELRLTVPMPNLLQVLAQPELALRRDRDGLGEMELSAAEGLPSGALELAMRPPESRGLPQDEEWQEDVRPVRLQGLPASEAIKRFSDGELDLVVGGRLAYWTEADPGPLSRGALRIDPALGLFGLQFIRQRGAMQQPEGREALSLSLDREALIAPFNIAGWAPTTRIVPGAVYGPEGPLERWTDFTLEERRGEAARRIASLTGQLGEGSGRVAIFLPEGPGFDRLFAELAAQWRPIGLDPVRAENRAEADLVLVDRVARFAAPLWYLNQFNCGLQRGSCSSDADTLVAQAVAGSQEISSEQLLQNAEARLLQESVYIPFGAPIRWSLVRGGLDGFAPNPWAFHPLPPMAMLPR